MTANLFSWFRRKLFSQWMLRMTLCLVTLLVLYYQWENWRSARELADISAKLIQRAGTDKIEDLLPPMVRDEDNFMANPVFESWKKPDRAGRRFPCYEMRRPELLMTEDFGPPRMVDGKGGWADQLDFESKPNAAAAAKAMAERLRVADVVIAKLASFTHLPFSVMKPQAREAWTASGKDPWKLEVAEYSHIIDFQRMLALNAHSGALVGDSAKVEQTTRVMLRLSESGSNYSLIGGLVAISLSDIALGTLHHAFDHPCWTAGALSQILHLLSRQDDMFTMENALIHEAVWMHQGLMRHREKPTSLIELFQGSYVQPEMVLFGLCARLGPQGWMDANIGFAGEGHLLILGEPGLRDWRTGSVRSDQARRRCTPAANGGISLPNPRNLLASIAIANIGSVHEAAARTLFKRRCVILACALERHRLSFGSFPDSLEPLKAELAAFEIRSPHRTDDAVQYRRESSGYLLWSPGQDALDDSGDAQKDWVWRRR